MWNSSQVSDVGGLRCSAVAEYAAWNKHIQLVVLARAHLTFTPSLCWLLDVQLWYNDTDCLGPMTCCSIVVFCVFCIRFCSLITCHSVHPCAPSSTKFFYEHPSLADTDEIQLLQLPGHIVFSVNIRQFPCSRHFCLVYWTLPSVVIWNSRLILMYKAIF